MSRFFGKLQFLWGTLFFYLSFFNSFWKQKMLCHIKWTEYIIYTTHKILTCLGFVKITPESHLCTFRPPQIRKLQFSDLVRHRLHPLLSKKYETLCFLDHCKSISLFYPQLSCFLTNVFRCSHGWPRCFLVVLTIPTTLYFPTSSWLSFVFLMFRLWCFNFLLSLKNRTIKFFFC